MSALPNSPELPEAAPEGAHPKPVHPLAQSSGHRRWPILILLFAALPAAWFLRPRPQAQPAVNAAIHTVKAARGVLEMTRRLSGSIVANRFANIAAPVLQSPDQGRGLTLIYVAASGARVKEGDVLAEIDAQAVKDHLDDVEASLSQAALDIRRREAQLVYQMEALRQRLRAAKATLDKAKQDARAMTVKTAITQELLKLAVDEAQEAYDEAAKQIGLTQERQQADLNFYKLDYQKQERHRNRHLADANRCTIKSPMSGMVVMQTVYRSGDPGQIQVGDLLAPGQPFMKVVDPASMQVDATMSQTEAELVHIGQPADLRFDAFPDLVLNGRVRAVGALAVGGRRLNYYVRRIPVRITIEETNSRVIPDLTASADIQIGEPVDGVLVPREAIYEADGKPVVYVRQSGAFVPREVEIGASNNTQVAVTAGVQEGDEVALQPPAAANE